MALKKEIRADNTYIISQNVGDNPKLGARKTKDGRESLYLDYYFGYSKEQSKATGRDIIRVDRRREYLKLYLWQAPRTPQERQQNKETMELAKQIRFERGQELLERGEGYRLKKDKEVNFLTYFQDYMDNYAKSDIRNIRVAYNRFSDFLRETPKYKKYSKRIRPEQIDRDMILAFTEYLQTRSYGEGAKTIYCRFKKVVKYAVDHDLIRKNPCNGISIKVDDNVIKKDVLSMEEVLQMASVHCPGENPNIRRAFLFCCYTGLRWCDVKDLTFANIDFANRLLMFEQNKTKGHSTASGVAVPLSENLLAFVGEPTDPDNRNELVFPLPSHTMCLKALRHWAKRAGITKHITWHCARHSFAVNILNNGANIKTVSSLLGHSSLRYTEKYTRAVDSLKEAAINSLPTLNLNEQ